ncbi:MAG: glycoside hydrolase family 15 protein [Bdellovibrionales bacterium]|nr:glycoside hydrolase family 15 protein [Bdellovibrionales bacterium]
MKHIPTLNHGLIGNGQIMSLISPDTEIQWLCMPRFDSPSVFASLLDSTKGGCWKILSLSKMIGSSMLYLENTNVLRTEIKTLDGSFEILDFAPRIPEGLSVKTHPEVCRLIRPIEGAPIVNILFDPRPNYGREAPKYIQISEGLEIQSESMDYFFRTNIPVSYVLNQQGFRVDQPYFMVFSSQKISRLDSIARVQKSLNLTVAGWRMWAKNCALPSFAAKHVLRSALCLKLHAFQDTGAIIASGTTSIPEALDTERTWDYRYCWLRDAAFSVEALRRIGHFEEGEAFLRFLVSVASNQDTLQPVYGIGGERKLEEKTLEHLEGFGGVKPVRIGNDAYRQEQHDLMGEMILCLETILTDPRVVFKPDAVSWNLIEKLVEQAIVASEKVDTGLWEYRTQLKHYTFSKVMCWVAGYRGARLAKFFNKAGFAERWEQWAEKKKADILQRGYNENKKFFTQALDGEFADASNLLLPTIGFIDAKDPRFVSTVRAYEKILGRNGLLLRYAHADDFGQTTSAFLICSFWWVEALAMMGELEKAIELFEKLVSFANPVGLFAEDIDPTTGEHLGNFPQAYTHVGLINAAITIGELKDAQEGSFRAWS